MNQWIDLCLANITVFVQVKAGVEVGGGVAALPPAAGDEVPERIGPGFELVGMGAAVVGPVEETAALDQPVMIEVFDHWMPCLARVVSLNAGCAAG